MVVRTKLKEVNREKQVAEVRFNNPKNGILAKLSFLEKTSLISLLNQEFKKGARPPTHQKKLFNLWRKEADICPDCIFNLTEGKLSLHERNA